METSRCPKCRTPINQPLAELKQNYDLLEMIREVASEKQPIVNIAAVDLPEPKIVVEQPKVIPVSVADLEGAIVSCERHCARYKQQVENFLGPAKPVRLRILTYYGRDYVCTIQPFAAWTVYDVAQSITSENKRYAKHRIRLVGLDQPILLKDTIGDVIRRIGSTWYLLAAQDLSLVSRCVGRNDLYDYDCQ